MIGSLVAAVGVLGLLTIAPGPDMAVVTRAALAGGHRPAAETAAGVVSGLLVWGLLAIGGLAAVLAASADAYAALRIAGAVYLVWLGLRTLWRSRARARRPRQGGRQGLDRGPTRGTRARPRTQKDVRDRRAWRTGLVTNLLNPKIGVFYTSVLPQLVPRGAPTAATQAGLVLAHAGLSLVWLKVWAWGLGRSPGAAGRPALGRALERIGGAALVGLGLEIAARTR